MWCWLNHGDSFSLLVDKFTFRVLSTHSKAEMECTLRNSQMLDEDNILNETPESSLTNSLDDESTGVLQLERKLEVEETQTTTANSVSFPAECSNVSEQRLSLAQRKRILPAWMLMENPCEQGLSPESEDNDVIQGRGKKAICKDKSQGNITQQGRKRLIPTGNPESMPSEDTEKKCKSVDQEESSIISTKKIQSLPPVTLNILEENNMKIDTQRDKVPTDEFDQISEHKTSDGIPDQEDRTVDYSKSPLSAQDKTQRSQLEFYSDPPSPETLQATASDSHSQGSEENTVKRTPCMYGAKCYRKNPVHFQHFSHPGDDDYGNLQVKNQDEADDRPVCPYGASCYRKNPQHRVEYRHDALQVNNISDTDSDNVGQPNEYDLNDSFIDDEEEEYEPTDEDSDWEPGKEDQEKEDVEELLKEAKKFMKRKK